MSAPIRLGPLLLSAPIGRGGMGSVWHGRHPEGVDVAVKVLRDRYAADEKLLRVFRFEVKSVASLDHPGIVRVYDYGVVPEAAASASDGKLHAGSPWLAMEYASGGTLAEQPRVQRGPLLRDYLLQMLDGLAHSHAREIIHRDLKPRNVLLREDGRLALTDFGIAHALSRASPAHAGAGTPGYMSPEQVRGEWRDMGPWTDLYSLGCLAWRLITGKPPFTGHTRFAVLKRQLEDPIPKLDPSIALPRGFEPWVRRLLAKDPTERFQCAADAAEELTALDWGEADTAAQPTPPDWRPRHPPTTQRPKGMGLALFLLRPWPIVGREAEQSRLWDALRSIRSTRSARVVVLQGDPGVGKSRLARWLCERAHEAGAACVVRVRHDREGRGGLASATRNLLRLRGLAPPDASQRLVEWLRQRGSANPQEEAARLVGLLFTEESGARTHSMMRMADPRQRLETWVALFDLLARDRPLLLSVDDLHRADEALDLVHALAGSARPVLVVTSITHGRLPAEIAEAVDALRELPGVDEIELGRLSDPDQRRLVDGGVGLTARLAEQLVQRTAGNPLFAVRTVVEWARQGMLIPTSSGFDLRQGARPRLPTSIRDHFATRIDPLERRHPAASLALELLAALGGERVRETDWAATCDEAGFLLTEAITAPILESGLAERTESARGIARWSLDHALLRDSLTGRAADAGRLADHHLAAGRALLAMPRGAARERGLHHLVEAGDREAALSALDELRQGLLLRSRVRSIRQLLDFEERILDRTGAAADAPRRLRIAADRASALLATSGDDEAHDAARGALSRAEASGDVGATAAASRVQLQAMHAAGQLRPTTPMLHQAEAWHRQLGDGAGLATVHRFRGLAHMAIGDWFGAETHLRSAAEGAGRAGDVLEQARSLTALGEAVGLQGRIDDAEPWLLRAQQAYLRVGNEVAAAELEALLAGLARQGGDLVRSRERACSARDQLRAAGSHTWFADLQVGLAHLVRGELSQARRELSGVSKAAESSPRLAMIARGALLCCAAGDWEAWDRNLADYKAIASDLLAVEPDSAWPLEWAARRAADAGDKDRAREAYLLAVARYELLNDQEALRRLEKRLASL